MRVLLVEDNPFDAELLREALADVPDAPVELVRVDRLSVAIERLAQGDIDEVLLDLKLPDSSGLDTLDRVQVAAPRVPVVVLTGVQDEVLATAAVRRGAQDYIVKGRLDGDSLYRSMRYAFERRRAEEAMRAAEEQRKEIERLKELDEFKARVVQAAAHELRTPLTPIRIQLHLLRTALGSGQVEEAARSLDIVTRNVERLNQLVEDVLDVARLQAGRLTLRRLPNDLNAVVAEAVESFHAPAESIGIDLALDAGPPLAVEVDDKRIGQVLFNLLSNALKFTPARGRIRVSTRREEDAAVVVVSDSGAGIDPRELGKLFQPFSQVHDIVHTSHGGSGLGLYISRGIVEAHGGTIAGTSEGLGRGATFSFRIPLTRRELSPGVPARPR